MTTTLLLRSRHDVLFTTFSFMTFSFPIATPEVTIRLTQGTLNLAVLEICSIVQDVARRKRGVALEPRPGFEAVSAGGNSRRRGLVESLTSADDPKSVRPRRGASTYPQDTIQDTWA